MLFGFFTFKGQTNFLITNYSFLVTRNYYPDKILIHIHSVAPDTQLQMSKSCRLEMNFSHMQLFLAELQTHRNDSLI